jgi:hypothetical protein
MTRTDQSVSLASEGIINQISKAVQELNNTVDSVASIEKMISLSTLLSAYDPPLATELQTFDNKLLDPTYFVATYFDTNDLQEALWVYRIVRLLARYVLLSDRFFETGIKTDALLANRIRRIINRCLMNKHETHYLRYSLNYSLRQFWTFWKFEQLIKQRVLEGHTFSYKEIRYFNMYKSSDASLIYSQVLDNTLPSFNSNISLVLHYNQALLDILDDWEDIEEDVYTGMPNLFVMTALKNVPYNRIKNTGTENIRKLLVNESDSYSSSVIKLVSDYQSSIRNIFVPRNLNFLKFLSDRYANTLRELITPNIVY